MENEQKCYEEVIRRLVEFFYPKLKMKTFLTSKKMRPR